MSEYRLIFSECHKAQGAYGWLSLHICQAAGAANIDEVNCAQWGPPHELNISRYSWARGEYCTYTWKVRNESFLSVLCQRSQLQCLYSPLQPKWFDGSFPPAFISSQIAQVDRLRIFERVISIKFKFTLRQSLRNFTSAVKEGLSAPA